MMMMIIIIIIRRRRSILPTLGLPGPLLNLPPQVQSVQTLTYTSAFPFPVPC